MKKINFNLKKNNENKAILNFIQIDVKSFQLNNETIRMS